MSLNSSDIVLDMDNVVKNERGLKQYLSSEHFPPALQDFMIEDIKSAPMRYFISDNGDVRVPLQELKSLPVTIILRLCTRLKIEKK